MVLTTPFAEATPVYHPTTHVAAVRFQKLGKLYHFDYTLFPQLVTGDFVIVETVRGYNMGQIAGFLERDSDPERVYKPILRIATPRDLLIKQQWEDKQLEVLIECREKAAQVGGYEDAKFIAAEYNYDGTLLTFMYTSEDTINTNRLKAALQKNLSAAIEFRQIGPRDVARILGGQGACGGPRCCSTFLTEFSPISVKMAKAQGIPLNPTEITGMCGRLRCCLIYEYEQYVEARKQLPRVNKVIGTPHGEGRVIEVYPLRDGIEVMLEDETRRFVAREDIVPLEEFRALQSKAAAGCTKNEGGGCDCGSRRPKSPNADLKTALELAHHQPLDAGTAPEEEDEDFHHFGESEIVEMPQPTYRPQKRRSPQRRSGGQKRPAKAEKPTPTPDEQKPKPKDKPSKSSRQRKPRRPASGQGE